MSPDQRETLATVQMLRFPSPTGLKETPTTRARRHRWSVYLSICLLMPALAAMIGIVAWAISIEVANENTANLIAASQQSKQHLQKQQQHQHKLSYLHLKQRSNQPAQQDDQSSTTWAKQPVASAVVVGEPASSDEEARWQARMAAKRASGAARRRVLPEGQAPAVMMKKQQQQQLDNGALLLTNIDQLSSEGQQSQNGEYSTGTKLDHSSKQSDTTEVGEQKTGSPTEAIHGSESPESAAAAPSSSYSSGTGEDGMPEVMNGEAPVDVTGASAWSAAKAAKKKAATQWLHHQRDRKVLGGKLPLEVSLEAHHGTELNENNKALMKKLESVSGGKHGLSKQQQTLIKQSDSTKVAPQQSEPVIVTTTTAAAIGIDSTSSSSSVEEEDAALHGAKSDGLIDYSGGSVPGANKGSPLEEDELANNGASGSNNDADAEELGYAAIASAISTSLASDSVLASTGKPHTSSAGQLHLPHPAPHLEGDTGRESRVSGFWNSDADTPLPLAARRRSAGENVAQVIDHIVERRKQSSNNLKGPQIVVVAPVGQSMMRAQSLTLETSSTDDHSSNGAKQHSLPPVQLDRRISSGSSLELESTPMTGAIVSQSSQRNKKQLTNVRVKRNRPIGARLLGTGIEETTGVANRRMDGSLMPNGMRFSERIQVIEDDDSSGLIAGGGGADSGASGSQQRIQEREEAVDMVESSKVPVSGALEPALAAETSQSSLMITEPRFSRQARHEPRQLTPTGDARAASNKLYLAEQVVREHVLRAQQRADKPIPQGLTSAQQVASSGVSGESRRLTAAGPAQSSSLVQPFSMDESASSVRSVSTGDSAASEKKHQPSYPQSSAMAPKDLPHHNNFAPTPQLSDQEFNVPAHLAESVIRQIERAPVEVIPFRGNEWPQFVGLQTPYVPHQQHQHQPQAFLSASASEPMAFWRQQYQQPIQRIHQHYMQASTLGEHQLARMQQQMQPDQSQAVSGGAGKWGLSGNRQAIANEQRSISTRAGGPRMALRHWLSSLRGHRSTVPVQQPAQARMPEPNQMDAIQPEAPIDLSKYATKTSAQTQAADQQQVAPAQQELQEVQDSYEQMSYQMPPSYGGGGGYDMHPPRHHYGNGGGDDNEKKSKGLTFHFGGGPIGGGSQLITSPMGIFKHLMIPLLPNPRVNLNGKVVFGVVLEKSTAFGEPKKKFKFWG